MQRRPLLLGALLAPTFDARADAAAADAAAPALRGGGAVAVFRHALAPGTFDPPGFDLADCSTQRNLDDSGRAQARRLGLWFSSRALEPARVRSSPWCRCLETARLAFGQAQSWPALGSPHGRPDPERRVALDELRQALRVASAERGRFEVWVTHQFVISALAGTSMASAGGLVLRMGDDGELSVLSRLDPA